MLANFHCRVNLFHRRSSLVIHAFINSVAVVQREGRDMCHTPDQGMGGYVPGGLGCVAQEYNRRKMRNGAFWDDRYRIIDREGLKTALGIDNSETLGESLKRWVGEVLDILHDC